jgi:hypothetical protein
VDAGREDDSASTRSRRELVQADVGVTKRRAALWVRNRDADAGRRGFEDEIAYLIEMGCDLDPTLSLWFNPAEMPSWPFDRGRRGEWQAEPVRRPW